MERGTEKVLELAPDEIDRDVISEGQHVIFDFSQDRKLLMKLSPGGKVNVGINSFLVDPVVGCRYGSLFEADSSSASLLKRKRKCDTEDEDWDGVLQIDRNNSTLLDAGFANQALTAQDLANMKAEGKSAEEIIASLAANSTTFQNKTQYSQDKYLKKKAKKYKSHITVVKPTARSLAEFYFHKRPEKIAFLRPDNLAILLSLANVGAEDEVTSLSVKISAACQESVSVEVAISNKAINGSGAVMERMGGLGSVVSSYWGEKEPSVDITRLFNFSRDIFGQHLSAPLAELKEYSEEKDDGQAAEAKADAQAAPAEDATAAAEQSAAAAIAPQLPLAADRIETPDSAPAANGLSRPLTAADEEKLRLLQEKQAERKRKLQHLCRDGFESCIIAAPDSGISALMDHVLPLLAPSAFFVIFHRQLQPLGETMQRLASNKYAVHLELQESWMREYQVLPGRTHPKMQTTGSGGYLLSGVKVGSFC